MPTSKKLVYRYDAGGYYAHIMPAERTQAVPGIEEAADFSMFDNPEEIVADMELAPGKLMLYTITAAEYPAEVPYVVRSSCSNKDCPYGMYKPGSAGYCCAACMPPDRVRVLLKELTDAARPFLADDICEPAPDVWQCSHCGAYHEDPMKIAHHDKCIAERLRQAIFAAEMACNQNEEDDG